MAVPDPPAVTPPGKVAPPAHLPAAAPNRASDGDVSGVVMRGSALRIASMGVTNVLVALGAVLLLRYLGVDEFGRYGTVMALVAIVQGVTDAGLTMTGTREMSLVHGDERRRLLSHVLGLRIVLTGAGILVAVLFAAAVGYDSELVAGTALAGVGVFLFSVQGAMLLPLAVEMRNGTLGLSEIIRQALMVIGWVLLILVGAGLDAFFAIQIAVGILLLAITPFLVGRHHVVRPRWDRQELRTLTAIGLPIAIAGVVAVIYYRVLTVIVSLVSTDEQSGLFVSASRVFEVAYAVPLILVTVILPVLTLAARDDESRLRYVMQRMTEAMSLAGIVVGLVVVGAAETIIVLLGGEEYREAAPVLQAFGIALVSMFTGSAWSPVLIATGRQKLLAMASLVGLVVVVVLGFALAPGMGAEGAGIAFAIADWVLLVTLYLALRRSGHGAHLDFRYLLRLIPIAAVAAAIALIPWTGEVLRTAVAVAVFLGAVWGAGLVPTEMLTLIRNRGAGPEAAAPTPETTD